MMWKIQHAMQDDAIHAARIHPAFISSCYPGWSLNMTKFPAHLVRSCLEKLKSQEPSRPILSYEHIENFFRDLEVRWTRAAQSTGLISRGPKFVTKSTVYLSKQLLAINAGDLIFLLHSLTHQIVLFSLFLFWLPYRWGRFLPPSPFHRTLWKFFLSPSCGLCDDFHPLGLRRFMQNLCMCKSMYRNLIIVICSVLVEVDCVAWMKMKFSNL